MTKDGPPPLPEASTSADLRRATPPDRAGFGVVVRVRAGDWEGEPFFRRVDDWDLLATMRSYVSCSFLRAWVDRTRQGRTALIVDCDCPAPKSWYDEAWAGPALAPHPAP